MFQTDERSVLTLLLKSEEQHGKYDPGSSTDALVNMFQKVHRHLLPTGVPMWVKNTRAPRLHCESILKKYGADL